MKYLVINLHVIQTIVQRFARKESSCRTKRDHRILLSVCMFKICVGLNAALLCKYNCSNKHEFVGIS